MVADRLHPRHFLALGPPAGRLRGLRIKTPEEVLPRHFLADVGCLYTD